MKALVASRRQILRALGVGAALAPLVPALDGWAVAGGQRAPAAAAGVQRQRHGARPLLAHGDAAGERVHHPRRAAISSRWRLQGRAGDPARPGAQGAEAGRRPRAGHGCVVDRVPAEPGQPVRRRRLAGGSVGGSDHRPGSAPGGGLRVAGGGGAAVRPRGQGRDHAAHVLRGVQPAHPLGGQPLQALRSAVRVSAGHRSGGLRSAAGRAPQCHGCGPPGGRRGCRARSGATDQQKLGVPPGGGARHRAPAGGPAARTAA